MDEELNKISSQLKNSEVPPDLVQLIEERAFRLLARGVSFSDIEQFLEYVNWVVNLPWSKRTEDLLDLGNGKKILDKNHYGLTDIKERILEFMAAMKLNKEKVDKEGLKAPILCFVGLVGTGKTTIALSIAQALGRKFVRIPFGGLGEVALLRGEARFRTGGEPGQIIKALRRVGVKNPVILLDEIDRIEERSRAGIMGALVEILDPEQNKAFMDSYLDYPFDLSEILFIATANNTTNIATAVLDRLEIIQMPSYSDEEKINIGKDFLLPKALEDAGLPSGTINITDTVWPLIVRPLGYDAGMRTLERTIQGVARKIAKLLVEGKGESFQLNETNIKEYLPVW